MMSKNFPPKSLEWYLDGTKWLVTISTASIVFAFGMMNDLSLLSTFDKTLFLSSALFLGLSSISGVSTFFYITSYVNTIEYIMKKNMTLEETKDKHEPLHKKLSRFYLSMLWCFGIGIGLFSIFVAKGVITNNTGADNKITVTELKTDNNFLIQSSDGLELLLIKDAAGYTVKDVSQLSD